MPENLYYRQESWWAYKTVKGRRYDKKLNTQSKKTARQRRDRWFEEQEKERWGERQIPTLREAARKFVTEHFPRLEVKTAQRYDTSLTWLLPEIGNLKLNNIKMDHLHDFEVMRKYEGVTDTTIIRDLACLSSIYGFMEISGFEDLKNPVTVYKKKRRYQGGLRESESRTRYLSLQEERILLEAASVQMRPVIAFAIDEGLRKSEQVSLLMRNVDLYNEEITVLGDKAKNHKTRAVPIKERTLEYLKTRHNKEYVFETQHGKPFSTQTSTLWEYLQKLCRETGIEDLWWHDLRRTCGCRLLQEDGMDLHEVKDWLGHSSVTVTEKAYAFLNIEKLKKSLKDKKKR